MSSEYGNDQGCEDLFTTNVHSRNQLEEQSLTGFHWGLTITISFSTGHVYVLNKEVTATLEREDSKNMEVRPAKLKCDRIENTGDCFFFLFSAEIKWLPLNCTFLLEQTQIHKTTLSLLKGLNGASCDFLVCLSLSI